MNISTPQDWADSLFGGLLQKLGKGTDLCMTFCRAFSYGQLRIQMETLHS